MDNVNFKIRTVNTSKIQDIVTLKIALLHRTYAHLMYKIKYIKHHGLNLHFRYLTV